MSETKLSFHPRGLGSNWLPCFMCGKGGKSVCQPDMASFVRNKSEGEAAVVMFKEFSVTADLDYRDYEPEWVQVKLGSCTEHFHKLEKLYRNIHDADNLLSRSLIKSWTEE